MTGSLIDDRLVDVVQDPETVRQAWRQHAACNGADLGSDAFFPADGETPSAPALSCCDACPVATECLGTALIFEKSDGYRHGWWGGYSPDDREWIATMVEFNAAPIPAVILPDPSDPQAFARHLRDLGRTIPAIAAELGCTKRSVHRYLAATKA